MDKQADPQPVQPELGTSPEEARLRAETAGNSVAEAGDSGASDAGTADIPQKQEAGPQEQEAGSATDSPLAGESRSTTEESEAAAGESEEAGEDAGMQWYVLKVQSNREKSIKQALERRIRREGLEDDFGYIMIQMKLTDDTCYLVRGTNGVGDFTGAAGKPIPMEESEIQRMLGKEREREVGPAKVKIDLSLGEMVKIKGGGFDSFEGTIDAIDEASGKITVLVEIFGRSTPVQLEHSQVERI